MTAQTRQLNRFNGLFTVGNSLKLILLFAAIFNFVWYFSGSSLVYHFGEDKITFCYVCPWYWDWSLTNPPSLLPVAVVSMLFDRWIGYLTSLLISLYVIGEGIVWVSRGSGFLRGLADRVDILTTNDLPFWMAPDWQYLFGLVVFGTASAFLVRVIHNPFHPS
jgi:hypothetical protein